MLRLLDIFGKTKFEATLDELSEKLGMKYGQTVKMMTGLRELGWIETERIYEKSGGNLPHVKGCVYKLTPY